jgi:hypothetical protein
VRERESERENDGIIVKHHFKENNSLLSGLHLECMNIAYITTSGLYPFFNLDFPETHLKTAKYACKLDPISTILNSD